MIKKRISHFKYSNIFQISESNTSNQENEDTVSEWKGGGPRSAIIRTPKSGILPMQNAGKVKFDPPKVPVIFVLGNLFFLLRLLD